MARFASIVLLLVLAIVCSYAQTGDVKAIARGGYKFIGADGEATGAISGEIRLGVHPTAELMFVIKDVGGATRDGQNEAIIFLNGIERSSVIGNKMVVMGVGTFQGEKRSVEVTLVDAKNRFDKDQIRIRVLNGGRVEFDQTAKLDSGSISITRQ
jgi:hypothetical protein